MELTALSIVEAAGLLRRREISAFELVEAHLELIQEINPRLNCFITLTGETALDCARQVDQEIRQGAYRGPLHGIPLALKDLYETRGVRTTAGSKFFTGYIPEQDACVVQKLHAAGAVLLGKLNMHEIALGVTNANPHFGPCRNPWSVERITGGSSGGSASALAAGLCLGSLGSDTGGSIRIPASLCGVVGLKPTFGRVSLRGVMPLSCNLDHAGPLGRSVSDVALLLQAIAGYDADDPVSVDVPAGETLGRLEAGVRGWRVALATGDYFNQADAEVLESVRAAAGVFEQLGARVTPVELEQARQAAQANGLMVISDAAAMHRERLQTRPQDFGEDVRQRLQRGSAYTSTEYSLVRRTQSVLRREFEKFFSQYDLLLTPTTPVAALELQNLDAVEQAPRLTRFTAPFNLTGLPALSLPCGFTAEGLPVGLQIVSRPWAEAEILRAAYAYEQATDWHLRRPDL